MYELQGRWIPGAPIATCLAKADLAWLRGSGASWVRGLRAECNLGCGYYPPFDDLPAGISSRVVTSQAATYEQTASVRPGAEH